MSVFTVAVTTAAAEVIDRDRTPGSMARRAALGEALDAAVANDPELAVVITAAQWSDRYGSVGAPERLAAMRTAVEFARTHAEAIP